MIEILLLALSALRSGDTRSQKELYWVTVDTSYDTAGLPVRTVVATGLDVGHISYMHRAAAHLSLNVWIDRSTGDAKIALDSGRSVLFAKHAFLSGHSRPSVELGRPYKADVHRIAGFSCFPVRARIGDEDTVIWKRVDDPSDPVAFFIYKKAGVQYSSVHIEERRGRKSDMVLFDFPAGAREIATDKRTFFHLYDQFFLYP